MALIRLRCPCGKRVKVAARFAGKTGKCPECGCAIPIPTLSKIQGKLAELHLDVSDLQVPLSESMSASGSGESASLDPAISPDGWSAHDSDEHRAAPPTTEPLRMEEELDEEGLEEQLDQASDLLRAQEEELSHSCGSDHSANKDGSAQESTSGAPSWTAARARSVPQSAESESWEGPAEAEPAEAEPAEAEPAEAVALLAVEEEANEDSSLEAQALENSWLLRALNPVGSVAGATPESVHADLVDQAMQAYNDGDVDQALLLLTKVITEQPQVSQAYYQRARVFLLLKAWDAALDDLQLARENGQDSEEVAVLAQEIHLDQARRFRTAGAYERALAELDQCPDQEDEELQEERREICMEKAAYLIRLGAAQAALETLEEAVTWFTPEDDLAPVHQLYAKAYQLLGDAEAAIVALTKAIALDKENARLYHARGCLYSKAGEYEKAIRDFSSALMIAAIDPLCYLDRANAYMAQQQYDKALEDYCRAAELAPEDPQIYRQRGICYRDKPTPELLAAMHDFRRAEELAAQQAEQL